MKRFVTFISLVALILSPIVTGWPPVRAAGATIIFAPGALNTSPGGKVSTTVMMSSDQSVNSLDFSVTFPASLVSVVTVDTAGTDFPSMFMGPPQVDNGAGTVHFLQSKVGGTTSGKIATIVFQAKSTGSGALGIKNGKAIANDGKGTNIYSGTSGGSINVQAQAVAATPVSTAAPQTQQSFRPTATSAPVISSTTHPDDQKWYNSRQVSISWTGGGSAYNFAFDQDSATQLPDKSAGSQTSATTTLASDGVWYAHVKSLGSSGWSSTTHFRLQADTKIPAEFTPTAEPAGHGSVMPRVSFSSHDETSGIDHYEARIDNGGWTTVTSPYTVSKLAVGSHTIQIKAVDKAGNNTVGEVKYILDSPDAPVITYPSDNQLFVLGQSLAIKGKADPHVLVDIYLNNKKSDSVKTDAEGNFVSGKKFMLFAGAYKLVAKAISPDGIISPPSDPISLTIDAKAVKMFNITLPGWLAFTVAGITFGIMLVVIALLVHRIYCLGASWKRRVSGMKQSVRDDLQKLEEQLDHEVDVILAGNVPQATAVKEEVAKAVDEVEQNLEKVGDEMLQPEPWLPALPILHGSERFSGAKVAQPSLEAPTKVASAEDTVEAVKDASIAYATATTQASKNPKTQESNTATGVAEETKNQTPIQSGQINQETKEVIKDQAEVAVAIPAVSVPTDQEPAPVAPAVNDATALAAQSEVQASELPAPTVDLFAPKIENIKQ